MAKNKGIKSTNKTSPQKPGKADINPPKKNLTRDWLFAFLLTLSIVIAYSPSWNGSQLWDDDGHITKPELRTFDGLKRIWTELGATQQYYPLLHTAFWLEYHLWSENTTGYHFVNIALHCISALLIVYILSLLKFPKPWFVAAVFSLHPVQVESVAWISELKNCLSGVFFFASILTYLKFDITRKKHYYTFAILLFILGLMSKSVIATMPIILLTVFWFKRGKLNLKKDFLPLLPFIAIGIVTGLFTSWVERKYIGAEGDVFNFTLIERVLIAGRVFWFYLTKLIFPVNLTFIYPRWIINQSVWWQYLFPVAGLLLAGVLLTIRKIWKAPLAALICYAVAIFPVMGFFNVYPFRYSFVADHFQYLACIGPIIIVTSGIDKAIVKFNNKNNINLVKTAIFGIIIATFGLLTLNQNRMYSDIETLYRTTIQRNPDCWMAYLSLGRVLSKKGLEDESISLYKKAIELKPDYLEAYNNLGNILRKKGQTDAAIELYLTAIKINPDKPDAYNNLAITYAQLHRFDEAIANYKKALEINPNKINTLNNLAGVYVQLNQINDAIVLLKKALSLANADGNVTMVKGISGNINYLFSKIDTLPPNP
jgi:tetratricopeptide (TPR) repeat protein